jgi:hypothetical protein
MPLLRSMVGVQLGAETHTRLAAGGRTLIGITPGIAIYVHFGIFGKGLGNGSRRRRTCC